MKLNYQFYKNNAVQVALDLIGKKLVFGAYQGIITETEAYRGSDDAASHAFSGITNRTKIMFGPAGYSYVYLIYGMYYCLNVTAEDEGSAAAVLIRGLMLPELHLNGPGKICRHLGITKEQNGINMVESDNFYITNGIKIPSIKTTPRIGIKKAIDLPWRFVADFGTNINK